MKCCSMICSCCESCTWQTENTCFGWIKVVKVPKHTNRMNRSICRNGSAGNTYSKQKNRQKNETSCIHDLRTCATTESDAIRRTFVRARALPRHAARRLLSLLPIEGVLYKINCPCCHGTRSVWLHSEINILII